MKSSARAAAGRSGPAPRARGPAWWRHPALGAALLALLLFLPAVRYGFVRDDRELFADNPFMRNPGYLGQLLRTDFWSSTGGESGLWRPLVTLSYWVEGRLGGWMPAGFHAVNVVSHVLVTALLALLMVAAGAGTPAAWIAALWFGLLPTHVEPVAWISGRTDVWCALFGLLALWLWQRGAGRGWAWRSGAVAAFALALLSKEAAVPLVAVLALLAWRRHADDEAPATPVLRELAPYAVLLLVWGVVHANVAPGTMAGTPGWPSPPAAERLWTALALYPAHLAFLLPGFPHGPDWWIAPARSAGDPRVALGVVLHLASLLLLIRTWRSRTPVAPALLLLWLPSLLMAGITLGRGVLLQGERHMYLPSAGAAWLIGIGGWKLWQRGLAPTTLPRVVLPVLFVGLLAFNAERSLVQLAGWRSDETMYRAMIRSQPERADGYLGLALVMIGQRNDRVALQALARADQVDSTRYESATYRAALATQRSDWPEVIRWTRNSIRRGALEADPWLMQINALQSLGHWEFARLLVDSMMVGHKTNPDVAAAFGRQMLGEDLPERAIKPLEYAVGWNPRDASLRLLLGDAFARARRPEKAVEALRQAAALEPGNIEIWIRLAAIYHSVNEVGLRDDAIRNAASLPHADTTRLRRLYDRMLRGEVPERR